MSSATTHRAGKGMKDRSNKPQILQTEHGKASLDGSKIVDGVNPKLQPTAEQMRIAQIINDGDKLDDPDLKKKVELIMELTGRSCDDASVALHDCDNDTSRAVNMLLEGGQNEHWETSGKKKRTRNTPSEKNTESNGTTSTTNNKENKTHNEYNREREPRRQEGMHGRPPLRMNRGGMGRSWRNRESEKNERNLEDRWRDRGFEGRPRGRRGGRGRGISRSRTFENRGLTNDSFPQSIETWNNSTAEQNNTNNIDTTMTVGNWADITVGEDWSEEDWTECLNETKVFTPSINAQSAIESPPIFQSLDLSTILQKSSPENDSISSSVVETKISQPEVIEHIADASQPVSASQLSTQSVPNQFSMSQYAQQAAETIKAAVGMTSTLHSANSLHVNGLNDVYSNSASQPLKIREETQTQINSQHIVQHSQSKTSQGLSQRPKMQRTRVPPPSKIPESAVEMPDDQIIALDVQFIGLEFGTDSSTFDIITETSRNYCDTAISTPTTVTSHMTDATSPLPSQNNSVPSPSASVSSSDSSIHSVSKDVSFTYEQPVTSVPGGHSPQNTIGNELVEPTSVDESTLGQAHKVSTQEQVLIPSQSEVKNVGSSSTYGNQKSSHSVVEGTFTTEKPSVMTSSLPSSNSYIHQNPSLTSLTSQQNSYTAVSQNQLPTTYEIPQSIYNPSTQSSSSATFTNQSDYNSQSASYSVGGSTFSGQHQVYNGSSPVTTHSVTPTLHSPSMSSKLHSYDTSCTTVNTLNLTPTLSSTSVNNSGSLNSIGGNSTTGLGLGAGTSTVTTSVLKNSYSTTGKTMPSIPPGVPAMLGHQYIMGQASLPFYGLQQPVYSYEDLQMLQSRLPPLGYYDMQFQAPGSLTGRDPNLGSVAYSGSDGRFNRSDNETSPVATTLSQGQTTTQAHGQPFLNAAALPPGYGYYFPGGMMPGSIHHYGPPIFPVSPATNAHGASGSTQFQKQSAYGSHSFNSGSYGYESLTQDYKGSYGNTQNQGKAGSGSIAGGDLSGTVYGKSHAKSFEKPGFHAGTPPPFNLQGTQTAGPLGASSVSYTAAPFIPVFTHGQHHSTMYHHHLPQDSVQAGNPASVHQRGGPQVLGQQKGSVGNKQNFAYWNN